jgi:vanillate O-demethylase monooxygenase subunit
MPFLQNIWYMFGHRNEVEPKKPAHRVIANEPILVYQKEDGGLSALRDMCPHRFAPLHRGHQVGDTIECGYHGLRFASDGACVYNPVAGAPIPRAAKVRSYPVEARYGIIWVWLGDPESANPDLIEDYGFLDDPARGKVPGYMHCKAHAQLIVDNLCDLTHLQFVHGQWQASEAFDRIEMDVRQDGNTVYTTLTFPNGRPPFFYENAVEDVNVPIDLSYEARWTAPASVLLHTRGFEVAEPKEQLFRILSAHIITPETERSAHYFFVQTRDYDIDSEEVDERVRAWQRRGFMEEDRPMIEAQQEMLGDTEIMAMQPVLLSSDAGVMRVRRVLSAMIDAEQPAQ